MDALHWLDWVIIGVVALSMLASLWRGFVKEALSLAAWVLAFMAATAFSDAVALNLQGVISNDTARLVAGWILVFIAALVLVTLVNGAIGKLVRAAGLSGIDRLLGMAFGFTRGLVVVLAILYVLQALVPVQQQSFMQGSLLVPQLNSVLAWIDANIADLPAIQLPEQIGLGQLNSTQS
ncbi:MAG: colicin V production protein [Gammaproteobacteria bacterium]|nr:MAG: colicin V production protein [Gammaproteobacteria bacterium]